VRTVPAGLLSEAVGTLSEFGADALAQRVDGARNGPWKALRAFMTTPAPDADSWRSLMYSAGHPEARLVVSAGGRDGLDEEREVLLDGPGGPDRFAVEAAAGRIVLRANRIDEAARALVAAVATRAPVQPLGRRERFHLAEAKPSGVAGMIGRSKALLEVQARIRKLAAHDLPVLILGESGTGKELLARQLHEASERASHRWLAVNCAALPESLLMSDLFGHVRGSFTGADRDRVGVFESADGGTVFLDEIGELPWAAQGMLLRLLQEGELRRVGESRPRHVDFRLVSATHRDLSEMVAAEKFREDLYYRLRVASVEAPPLRERGEDVVLLAHHFLARFGADRNGIRFSEAALQAIRDDSWPGNVRALQHAIEGAIALAEGPLVTVEMLGLADRVITGRAAAVRGYHWKMEQYRRRLITAALADAKGNQARAARALGMSRQALSYLVRKLNYSPMTDLT